MRKRGVALFLAALMVWVLIVPATAQGNPFSDLQSDHWAYEAVVKLAAAGLVEGYPDGTFGGDRTFTRYEMAMVFARVLARFERLIDEKIAEGIDVRTDELAEQIRQTRSELTRMIEANHDELSAALERLAARLDKVEGQASVSQTSGSAGELTPDANAALADHVASELAERLRDLATQSDLDELAARIARIESKLEESAAEARRIAEMAIADALAARDDQVQAALSAAQGDSESLAEIIGGRVSELSREIDRMADEFRPELERLGVKVAELENRIMVQGATLAVLSDQVAENKSDIATLQDRVGNIRLTGKSETTLEQTAIEGPGTPYKDPRDEDSDEYEAGNTFESKLTVGIEANPAENVDVKAELVLNDIFGGADELKPGVNLDVTTPGVLRQLHVGDLDKDAVAEPFDKYTLTAKKFGDKQGANVDLVFGYQDSTSLSGFVSRQDDADHVFGAAASYTLSEEFDFVFRGVKQSTTPAATTGAVAPESDAAIGVEVSGLLDALEYSANYVTENDATPDTAVDAWAKTPLLFTLAQLRYAAVGADFDPAYGKDLDSKSDDWLDRKLTPPADWVEQGESDMAATFSAPLLGVDTAVTVGQRNDPNATEDTNTYTQVEVGQLRFAGLDTGLLYDRRTNAADQVDNTVRATFGTTIAGADVAATVHSRSNAQVAAPESDQRSTWLTATKEVELLLPFTVDARYAMNQALGENSALVGVGTEYQLGSVLLNAGYSTEQNALGDVDEDVSKSWWKNAEWAGNDKRDIAKLGAAYTLKGFFGTDIDTGYEYRLVRVNDATLGTARSTFTASFEKALRGGEATLAGEGKYVTGGIPSEDGNDSDLSAKLTLTYPVFDGADLKVGGELVNSAGAKRDDYSVYHLNAGLTVQF